MAFALFVLILAAAALAFAVIRADDFEEARKAGFTKRGQGRD